MSKKRRNHSPEFKSKVALVALQGDQTTVELSHQYDINSNLVMKWKKHPLARTRRCELFLVLDVLPDTLVLNRAQTLYSA